MGTKVHVSRMFHGKLLGLRIGWICPIKQVGQVVRVLHIEVHLPASVDHGGGIGLRIPDGPSILQLAKFVAHGEAIGAPQERLLGLVAGKPRKNPA